MRAIILAAGKGSRMKDHTKILPKGMLPLNGKAIISRQIETLQRCNITDITLVTGFSPESIESLGFATRHNPNFASTNMIESFMCAKDLFDDDVLLCYADIIYSDNLLNNFISKAQGVSVAVDSNWKPYWKARYGTTEADLESLTVDASNNILELGKELTNSDNLKYRYLGLNYFSKESLQHFLRFYDQKKTSMSKWDASGKDFLNGYMTDLLTELIQSNLKVTAIPYPQEWLEFDTPEDYALAQSLSDNKDYASFLK